MLFGQDSNVVLTGDGSIKVADESLAGKNHLAIYTGNNSNLTIDGGNYTATGSVRNTENNVAIFATGTSTVTINGGAFYATGPETSLIIADGSAKIYIKGGFFKSEGAQYGENLNVQSNSPNAAIIVSGGTFVNFDPSKEENGSSGSSGNHQVKIADGYKVEQQPNGNDIWYVVVPE